MKASKKKIKIIVERTDTGSVSYTHLDVYKRQGQAQARIRKQVDILIHAGVGCFEGKVLRQPQRRRKARLGPYVGLTFGLESTEPYPNIHFQSVEGLPNVLDVQAGFDGVDGFDRPLDGFI